MRAVVASLKPILIILLIACVSEIKAQSLAFSQVKLVSTQETVPVGKVWKVESVIYNIPFDNSTTQYSTSANCGMPYYRNSAISVNGVPTKVGQGSLPAGYSSVDYIHSATILPIWLPAGATLSGGPCNNQISVIEFTVVP